MPHPLGRIERVCNCYRVAALFPSVGCHFAAARAMCTRIHGHNAVSMEQKKFGGTERARAVVGNSMKEQYPITVWLSRVNLPPEQLNAILGANVELLCSRAGRAQHRSGLLQSWKVQFLRVENSGSQEPASDCRDRCQENVGNQKDPAGDYQSS